MKRAIAAATWVCTLALVAGSADAADRGVSNAALAQGARDARLDQIDAFKKDCGDNRRVEDWLKQLVGKSVKSIHWTGGRCQIVNKLNPIDAGTDWCGQAVIVPSKGAGAMIEIFFEKPAHGKPGVPFAFRGAPEGVGTEFVRHPREFEAGWKAMHVPGYKPPDNPDCD